MSQQEIPPVENHREVALLAPFERIRLEKAATDEGFGVPRGDKDGWLAFESLGSPVLLRLTANGGRYLVATDHAGVIAELALRFTRLLDGELSSPPSGFVAFVADDTASLHDIVGAVWHLSRSLPQVPLHRFVAKARELPCATEAERLVIQRVGQDIYREALMAYWRGRCAVTGLAVPELLRASHAKPWKDCETDAERLDVYNGLLLAAHLDAAFDSGLIAVAADGMVIASERLDLQARGVLGLDGPRLIRGVAPAHEPYLAWHRRKIFR